MSATTHSEENIMQEVVEQYLECWNETDPAARRKLIEQVWAPDASYTDPLAEVTGRAAIDATIAAVQGQFPGFVFALAGPVDAHHRQARFSWSLAPAGEEAVVAGSDVALTGPDGQITAVFGFLDKVPAI
jgi:SnoaL-like domain